MDILTIDNNIHRSFDNEKRKLKDYSEKLAQLLISLDNPKLTYRIKNYLSKATKELADYIDDLENNRHLNYYIVETAELIRDYNKILKTPMKMSFVGKHVNTDHKKVTIVKDYLEIAKKYDNIEVKTTTAPIQIKCSNCSNKKHFDIIDDNTYVCQECFSEQTITRNSSSWKDIDRVNISSKYMYDRKVHFRDCINQYQGVFIFRISFYIF
jgi:Zn finger protein HypA/HybF involved in hydrogenase expression